MHTTWTTLGAALLTLLLPLLLPMLALLIDRRFGEPPLACHPVVGMGKALSALGRRLPAGPPAWAFASGAAAWLGGALVVLLLAAGLQWALGWLALQGAGAGAGGGAGGGAVLATLLATVLTALLLKPLLALRLLVDEVRAVDTALGQSLAAARAQVARICSRDTSALDATQLRETAIESLAENLNDSVIAPLFWFALAGLPGAALYRWANTADAMWGYRSPRWAWAGKWAARADDVLSWLPARLTALLLWPTGQGRALWAEAGRTPSPNGGWPMGAMALQLGIRLGKPGVYTLHGGGRAADSGDIHRAIRLAQRAAWIGALLLGLLAAVLAAAPVLLASAALPSLQP